MDRLVYWHEYTKVTRLVESQEVTNGSNADLSAAASKRMTVCNLKLLTRAPFFGHLAMKLKFIEHNSLPHKTMATDGMNIYYDPGFVMEHTEEEIKWVICHEIMHCALVHFLRKQADPNVWNVAADYEVNQLIDKNRFDGAYEVGDMPASALGSRDDKNPRKQDFIGLSAENIYQILLEHPELMPPNDEWNYGGVGNPGSIPPPPGGGGGGGQQSQGGSGEEEEGGSEGDGGVSGGSATAPGEIPAPKLKDEVMPTDADGLKKYWENALKDAITRNAGNMPGNLKRHLENLMATQLDWRKELKKFMTQLSRKTQDVLPNKRFLGSGQVMWGEQRKKTTFDNMVIICDTSGSMSQSALETAVGEAAGILAQFKPKNTYVLWCDTNVYEPVDKIRPGEVAKLKQAYGGGGTDFRPPFKWIQDNILGKGKMGPVIFFTDGYPMSGGWPQLDQFGLRTYASKVIWVITNRGTVNTDSSIQIPFGQRLDLVHD